MQLFAGIKIQVSNSKLIRKWTGSLVRAHEACLDIRQQNHDRFPNFEAGDSLLRIKAMNRAWRAVVIEGDTYSAKS